MKTKVYEDAEWLKRVAANSICEYPPAEVYEEIRYRIERNSHLMVSYRQVKRYIEDIVAEGDIKS
jgi:hypothetical protein